MASAAPNWTRHVKDLTFEDLERLHDELMGLVGQPGWTQLAGLLDAERRMVDQRLDHGDRPLEQADYALLHGQRAGLAAPEAAIQAVVALYEERRSALLAAGAAENGRH